MLVIVDLLGRLTHGGTQPSAACPQAVCSRYGLAVGAASASIVRVLMFLCWPIAKPISLILDSVLGHGKTVRSTPLTHFHVGACPSARSICAAPPLWDVHHVQDPSRNLHTWAAMQVGT